jgi:hypothetical protein
MAIIPPKKFRLGLATCLMIVAAVAATCALADQIRRTYAAIPPFASPACPEFYATPAVLLWIILGATATFAWRRCSVTRLAAQVALSCLIVMSQRWIPAGVRVPGAGLFFEVFWPVACFGLFFVTPLLLRRFSRIGDPALLLADSSVVALLAYVFAVRAYIPKG